MLKFYLEKVDYSSRFKKENDIEERRYCVELISMQYRFLFMRR